MIVATGPLTARRWPKRCARWPAGLPLLLRRHGAHRRRREHGHGGRVPWQPLGQASEAQGSRGAESRGAGEQRRTTESEHRPLLSQRATTSTVPDPRRVLRLRRGSQHGGEDQPHQFEADEAARRYFEACLPIEVLAAVILGACVRADDAVGLRDRAPAPAVRRRAAPAGQRRGTLYNLVGFQTNIKWGDQERVLRMIPGLASAEFVRFGQMHRNTFINSPRCCCPRYNGTTGTICSSPGRSPAQKGTSAQRRAGCWRA